MSPRRSPRRLAPALLALTALVCAVAATVVPATPAAATARPAAVTAAAQVDPATRDSKAGVRLHRERPHQAAAGSGGCSAGRLDCASVFADTAPTWATWEDPWFAHMPIDQPQYAWKKWLDAGGRTLVISQSLVPNGIDPDWRAKGAAGEYDDHVRALARNLVSYDMGGSIIRLAHEANGNWSYDWLGDTAQQRADWKAYWARFAAVMNSVPGASFEFDWTVNAASPAVPFDDYYPGDAAVDVIGIDQYDWASAWVGKAQPARFAYQRSLALGLDALVAFGKAHGKPLSVPEWGLVPASIPEGMGDDPAYADLLAAVVRDNPTRYQSYFEVTGTVNQKPGRLGRHPRRLEAPLRRRRRRVEAVAGAPDRPDPDVPSGAGRPRHAHAVPRRVEQPHHAADGRVPARPHPALRRAARRERADLGHLERPVGDAHAQGPDAVPVGVVARGVVRPHRGARAEPGAGRGAGRLAHPRRRRRVRRVRARPRREPGGPRLRTGRHPAGAQGERRLGEGLGRQHRRRLERLAQVLGARRERPSGHPGQRLRRRVVAERRLPQPAARPDLPRRPGRRRRRHLDARQRPDRRGCRPARALAVPEGGRRRPRHPGRLRPHARQADRVLGVGRAAHEPGGRRGRRRVLRRPDLGPGAGCAHPVPGVRQHPERVGAAAAGRVRRPGVVEAALRRHRGRPALTRSSSVQSCGCTHPPARPDAPGWGCWSWSSRCWRRGWAPCWWAGPVPTNRPARRPPGRASTPRTASPACSSSRSRWGTSTTARWCSTTSPPRGRRW
nr:glycosyl hydrolase [Angustibacter aerolatus]